MVSATKVFVAYVYGAGGLDAEFAHSLERMKEFDDRLGSGFLSHGAWKIANGGSSIPIQRNRVVRTFLETDGEWLWFVDTDETFDPDILERLVASADAVERPIISGLVMAYRPGHAPMAVEPACAVMDTQGNLITARNIPAGNPWEVAAVGAGCLFVHRSVFEKILAADPDSGFPWFQNAPWRRLDKEGEPFTDAMGEDYVFSLRAGAAGFPILVDTDIVCGHRKLYEFTTTDYWRQVPWQIIEPRTYAIIPVKDQRGLTEALLKQLADQGEVDGVIVLDNGSAKETRRYLARQTIAEVIPAADLGIHEMWNLGATIALKRWPKCNLAFLNNDLVLGPRFMAGLSEGLRSRDDLMAISPNYDGRPLDGLYECPDICANRYDGTGGAPGFAFMLKGEVFQQGYRFPDECRWWYGDNDLLLTIRQAGGVWALTPDVTVEHVNGGGQTGGDWSAYLASPQHAADRRAFAARWGVSG